MAHMTERKFERQRNAARKQDRERINLNELLDEIDAPEFWDSYARNLVENGGRRLTCA